MSTNDPSACPAPRSLREQVLRVRDAIALELTRYPKSGHRYEMLGDACSVLSGVASALLASLPGDAAQDARQAANEIARAFRAGWATGFQECAEGATIDLTAEQGKRPALETAALERWLFVEAASAVRGLSPEASAIALPEHDPNFGRVGNMTTFSAVQDAPPAPQGWQPIATAPKDGSNLLALIDGWPYPVTVTWQTAEFYWIECGRESCRPTHWMPLPAPPASEDTK